MNTAILTGLTLLTVIQIASRAQELERWATSDDSGKWRGMLLLPPYGRILVVTDFSFETEADAKVHMDAVVNACVEHQDKRQKVEVEP